MFADSLIESNWARTSRRGWTTLASFALQIAVVAMLLTVPLIYTEALPQLILLASPGMVAPAPLPPSPPVSARPSTPHSQSNLSGVHLLQPPSIPRAIADIRESSPPVQPDLGAPGVLDGTGDRRLAGVLGSTGNPLAAVAPPPATPASRPRPVSVIMEGYLVHKVEPAYPPMARTARIQGPVELRAIISKEGTIENLRVVSGHPMLAQAALAAVRQWRYRPYILNGAPVEVETEVIVKFVLSAN